MKESNYRGTSDNNEFWFDPEKGAKRLRIIPTKGLKKTSMHFSNKFNKIHLIKSYETDLALLLEYVWPIEDYKSNTTLVFPDENGVMQKLVPSFVVEANGEEVLYDVVPRSASPRSIAERKRLLQLAFQELGLKFVIVKPSDLETNSLITNVRILRQAFESSCPSREYNKFIATTSTRKGLLSDLSAALESCGMHSSLGYRFIAHKLISCDLSKPLACQILSWVG